MKRMPVRGQAAKWCMCGEWFASERDEREHRCPGPMFTKRQEKRLADNMIYLFNAIAVRGIRAKRRPVSATDKP